MSPSNSMKHHNVVISAPFNHDFNTLTSQICNRNISLVLIALSIIY